MTSELDTIHHVAMEVPDVPGALKWYVDKIACRIAYEDATWALLEFGNMSLALVLPGQHPRHVAFVTDAASSQGTLQSHRDGTRSVYISDPAGNAVELIDPSSVETPQSV